METRGVRGRGELSLQRSAVPLGRVPPSGSRPACASTLMSISCCRDATFLLPWNAMPGPQSSSGHRMEASLSLLSSEGASRLLAPRPASRLAVDEKGRTTWRRVRHGRVLADDDAMSDAVRLAKIARSSGQPEIVLGVGDGERLEWL